MGLDDATIEALIAGATKSKAPQAKRLTESDKHRMAEREARAKSQNRGPVRWYDKFFPCTYKSGHHVRGCGSTTCIRINGKAHCMTHAIIALNEMLYTPEELLVTFESGEYDGGEIL